MDSEDHLLLALTALGRIRSLDEHAYKLRLKLANRIVIRVNAYIQETVLEAVDKTKPGHLTWQEIADLMELSKTAVFSRYGKNKTQV